MKRMPRSSRILRSLSSGSMTTKRDLSYSKCRSIKGNVPLPIEPKPIITMGPEIFAWISEGLMGMVSPKKCWRYRGISGGTLPLWAAPLGGDFDLDLHFGFQQRGDHQHRSGRTDIAQDFAADCKMRVRVLDVDEIVGRADNIGHCKTGLFQGRFDGLEAVSCLACDIRGHGHGGVIVAGSPRNEGEISVDDRAAVASGLFERGACGNETSGHGETFGFG